MSASRRQGRAGGNQRTREILEDRGFAVGPKRRSHPVGSTFDKHCRTCNRETNWQIYATVDKDSILARCLQHDAKPVRVPHPGKPDARIVKVPRKVHRREFIRILNDSERHLLAREFSGFDPARFGCAGEAKVKTYIKDDVLGSGRVVELNARGVKGMFWTGIWLLPT